VIKLRRIRWAGHVACVAEMRLLNCMARDQRSVGNSRRKPENIIKVFVRERVSGLWTGFMYFEAQVAGCCEHGHEPSFPLKCRKCRPAEGPLASEGTALLQ
jgi:hypothetical protein